jgi:hypothetical protein
MRTRAPRRTPLAQQACRGRCSLRLAGVPAKRALRISILGPLFAVRRQGHSRRRLRLPPTVDSLPESEAARPSHCRNDWLPGVAPGDADSKVGRKLFVRSKRGVEGVSLDPRERRSSVEMLPVIIRHGQAQLSDPQAAKSNAPTQAEDDFGVATLWIDRDGIEIDPRNELTDVAPRRSPLEGGHAGRSNRGSHGRGG